MLENAETLISRPPTPEREEMPSHPLENSETLISRTSPLERETIIPARDENRASTDVEDTSDESEHNDPGWVTTKRSRAQSLDSARTKLKNKNIIYLKSKTLSSEQKKLVAAAANNLTQEQRDQVQRRQDKVAPRTDEDELPEPQPEAGPSRHKGKAVDPREWGNAGIEPEELDINVQEAILKAYNKGRKARKHKKYPRDTESLGSEHEQFQVPPVTRHTPTTRDNIRRMETQRAGSRPAAQIVPNSSLGVALGKIARMSKDPEDPSDPTSSEYESSIYSRSTRSYSSSRSRHKRRHGSKRRSRKRSQRRRRRSGTSIKPIPPKDYDGAVDARAYHRFVMEGEAYLRDGKVHKERQIRILAHYLDGKAYNFYMQKVASDDPNNWTLHKFFTELFNYCFPVDYRQRMRLKLEDFHQKINQSVSEYVFELQELFSMVGTMPDDMKVIKLWYSLNPKIQRAMWRDGLHPDSSTWDEVVAKAEIIEIAHSVTDRREVNKSQPKREWLTDKQPGGSASRSVSYTNRERGNNHSRTQWNRQDNKPTGGQIRQSSTVPSGKGYHPGKSAQRSTHNGTKHTSQKKSVQFADLTAAEMAQLRAEGRCFNCKEIGHMSRNCPHKKSVKGNGTGKPPGLPSFSMEMNVVEDDNEETQVLDSMPVGSIDVGNIDLNLPINEAEPDEGWRKWYPIWQHPQAFAREEIGNCYEMAAEYLLTIFQPYPGDELATYGQSRDLISPDIRFRVSQLNKTNKFRITDRFHDFEVCMTRLYSQIRSLICVTGMLQPEHEYLILRSQQ